MNKKDENDLRLVSNTPEVTVTSNQLDAFIGNMIADKLEKMTSELSEEQLDLLVRRFLGIEEDVPMAKAANKKNKKIKK